MVDLPVSGSRHSWAGSVSRRSLMGVGVAGLTGLVVSGCSVGNPMTTDTVPPKPAGLAPDVTVATSALAEIKVLSTAVTATMARFPATRSRLSPLAQMHRAHEASLADAVPRRATTRATAAPSPYVVPRKRDAALGTLRAREQELHSSLDALALRAQSGDFARLLASMGAAVSQQLAVLTS